MKKIVKFGIIPGILVLVIAIFTFFLLYSFNVNKPASEQSKDIHFVIEEGQGVKVIGKNLLDQGLIRSKFWFELYVWFQGKSGDFQAGDYILNTNNSIVETVRILTAESYAGRTEKNEVTIQIPEGWTLKQIGDHLEEKGVFSQKDWLDAVGHPRTDHRQEDERSKPMSISGDLDVLGSKPEYLSWEGYMFPDTYRIYNNSNPKEVAWKMLSNLDSKLTPKMLRDIKKQDKTIHEILSMASLLEKEVSNKKDMEIVSGIFWTKLKRGERLRSCATLAYILEENKAQYTTEDTQVRSDYNTYANKGLPPTPICNPGLQAIKAAIYPQYSSYNFFLTDPETKKTIFSKTFSEHKRNKEKYLK